jgi:UDP-3-O-[3-hydroxymyristoyl] glucosamine N-acyltransferase
LSAISISALSEHIRSTGLENTVSGDGDITVSAVNTVEEAGPGELTFLTNPRYREVAAKSRASAMIVGPKLRSTTDITSIVCDDPYAALCVAIVKIHGHRQHPQWGISPHAWIAETARIGPNANIGPGVSIAERTVIGEGAVVYPGCYIASDVVIGDNVLLYPNVVIYDKCQLGTRVTIHAGSVIGEDGLGYAPVEDKWTKIPQVGTVEIGDDVEIGAACTIDRATVGSTRIGSGTKFSNLVAIGHGTKVGEDCLFVAQVGLAGSVNVGRHVTFAGQSGAVGHIKIGDNAKVGAQAGVTDSIPPGGSVLGAPATPISEARRHMISVRRLPEMKARLRALDAEVQRLRRLIEEKAEPRSERT